MAEKKDPGKFTIGLNTTDPSHRVVISLLNQQGRRKAQFIVNAVLHYIHCPETPDIPQPAPVDSSVIEEVVLRILQRQGAVAPPIQPEAAKSREPVAVNSESIHIIDEVENLLGKEGMSTIANTLTAFRNG